MTDELLKELIDIVKAFKNADLLFAITYSILIVMLVIFAIYETHLIKKKKKWIQEYKATLTEEQRKAINDYKELNK